VPADAALAPALVDHRLMSMFPTPSLGTFTEPTTLVDCDGRILLWYLPGILDSVGNVCCAFITVPGLLLTPNPQDTVMRATRCLKMKPSDGMGARWRNQNFREGEELEFGCNNFSPAWFPLGQTVSFVSCGCLGGTDLCIGIEPATSNHLKTLEESRSHGVANGDQTS